MQAILYYISLPFIYLISVLPLSILYKLSDLLFYINFYIIKYRRTIVWQNLKNSYPNVSEIELRKIEKDFFRVLTDYIIEAIKALTISKKGILALGEVIQNNEMNELTKNGRNIIVSTGHVANQEMVCLYMSSSPDFRTNVKAIYHQLANPYFEKLFLDSRQRHGSVLIPMKKSREGIKEQDKLRPFSFFLINDQSASLEKAYWSMFLNQETCFYRGMAEFAKAYDMPVYYMHIDRPGRGRFILSFKKITNEPKKISESEILEKHVKYLEENILKDPQIWLWSHKRWKSKRLPNQELYK